MSTGTKLTTQTNGALIMMKTYQIVQKKALAKTATGCLVGIVLVGCGGGSGSGESDTAALARTQTLANDVSLAYVERNAVAQTENIEQQLAAFVQARSLAAPSGYSPFDINRGASLKIQDTLDVNADKADILASYFGSTDYDVKDLSVSPDGTKLLFAAIGAADSQTDGTWNIYEYSETTKTMRRIIADDAIANAGHDVSPAYGPNGEIVFSSDRAASDGSTAAQETFEQEGQVCYEVPNGPNGAVLHMMNADGSGIEQLTSGLHYDVKPGIMSDGKIVFARISNYYEFAPHCSETTGTTEGAVSALLQATGSDSQAVCDLAVASPLGPVVAGTQYEIMRIDLSDRTLDLLYQPVLLVGGSDTHLKINKIVQSENGNLMILLKHSLNPFSGGTLLELQSPESIADDSVLGNLAPRVLTGPIDQIYPGTTPEQGLVSAVTPFYDDSSRVLISWSQCILDDNGINSFCDANTSVETDNITTNYGLWVFDPASQTRLPVLSGSGQVYGDAALIQSMNSLDWPHQPFMANYGLASSPRDVICTGNIAPTANAGPDQTVQIGNSVTLTGAASSDINGDLLSYAWSVVRQPEGAAVSLSDTGQVSPEFEPTALGEYEFQLVVSDGELESGADTVIVTIVDYEVVAPDINDPNVNNPDVNDPNVNDPNDPNVNDPQFPNNQAPTANAGPDQAASVGQEVVLDGSASTDPDGDALTYSWRVVSAPPADMAMLMAAQEVQPRITVNYSGDYVFELIVNDGKVDSMPDTVVVSTNNLPPVAIAGDDVVIPVGGAVILDGSESYDPEGQEITYQWSIVSAPDVTTTALANTTSFDPTFQSDKAADYVIHLIVNDGELDSVVDEMQIQVKEEDINLAPIADAGDDMSVPVNGVAILDGSDSSDPENQPLTYAWSILSQPMGSTTVLQGADTVMPQLPIDVAGYYTLQLIVNDGQQNSQPDTVVVATENTRPIADAGLDIVTPEREVTLDGSGSRDPDGDALTYAWSITYKPDGAAATLVNPTDVQPTLMADLAGDYVITLLVNDGVLTSEPDAVQVMMQAKKDECEEDKNPPDLKVDLDNNYLWAPNHKYVDVTLNVEATDDCDKNLTLRLVSITSNEADNGKGDGNTVDDITGATYGTDDRTFSLRAERSGGNKAGRVYTIVYEAVDDANNVTRVETQIFVRHDQRKMD